MNQSRWPLLALTLRIFISVEDLVDQEGLACRCFLAVLAVRLDQVDQRSRLEVQGAPVLEAVSWARVPESLSLPSSLSLAQGAPVLEAVSWAWVPESLSLAQGVPVLVLAVAAVLD